MTVTAEVDGKKKVFVDNEWKNDFVDEGRYGMFKFADQFFGNPYTVMKILGSFLITQCNFNPGLGKYVYYASSPLFRPVELGGVTPEYEITYDSKTETVSVEEVSP